MGGCLRGWPPRFDAWAIRPTYAKPQRENPSHSLGAVRSQVLLVPQVVSSWHPTCPSTASASLSVCRVFVRLLLLVVAAVLAYHFAQFGPQTSGALASTTLERNGYRIVPLQSFTFEAKVLSTRRYRFDRESDLAPVDLALGWGPMADPAVSTKVTISQSDRWYYWRAAELPLPAREIGSHSANMHMIPATPAIERRLVALRRGDVVRLRGSLVEAQAPDGWRWRSSLSREDTGAGACELVWVEELDLL